MADIPIYADVLNLLLEIINSSLTCSLNNNPHLIYALLHRKEMFTQFRFDSKFAKLIANIDMVVS
jgi:hypothetical protein